MKYEDNGNKIYILLILYLLYIIKNNRIKNIINNYNFKNNKDINKC